MIEFLYPLHEEHSVVSNMQRDARSKDEKQKQAKLQPYLNFGVCGVFTSAPSLYQHRLNSYLDMDVAVIRNNIMLRNSHGLITRL